jgi:nucleoside-diphosphate-sugar epimerase
MRILITGADQPLGALAARALRADPAEHEIILTGAQALTPGGLGDLRYTPADLREPTQVTPLLEGVQAVLHLAPHQAVVTTTPASECEALDLAARGTFVLLHAALAAGVERLVLGSRLELMAAYPDDYVVDETWKPQPDATAASLAPYLAELSVREFVRAEAMLAVCLRLGDLGSGPADTTPQDAEAALQRALTADFSSSKYRWWLYHICSTNRYPLGAAAHGPFKFERTAAAA